MSSIPYLYKFNELLLLENRCTECGKSCLTEIKLKSHMEKHTKEKSGKIEESCLVCDICKRGFVYKSLLEKHLKRHVMEKSNPDSKENLYTKFMRESFDMSCDLCAEVFVSVYHARRHYIQAHNMERGYIKCCNIKMRTLPVVMGHIEAHLNPNHFK